ncbi:MAG: hypothetical protein ABI612_12175 [Betaproteobacteria bacterium]
MNTDMQHVANRTIDPNYALMNTTTWMFEPLRLALAGFNPYYLPLFFCAFAA